MATFAQDVEGALEVTALMRGPERPRDVRALGWLEEAHLEMSRGRLTAARAALLRAGELGSTDAASAAAWIAELPFVAAAAGAGSTGTRGLRSASRPSVFFSVHDSVHDAVNTYVRGLGAVRRREDTAVASAVAVLQTLAGHPATGALAGELARGLRAQDEAASGRVDQALQQLEAFDPAGWYERTFVSPFFAGAMERFRRAELLQRAGRLEEALGWYNGLTENSTRELVFLGPSLLRRSQILETLGRGQDAIPLLERFLQLWSASDAGFAPMVTEARERPARVRPR